MRILFLPTSSWRGYRIRPRVRIIPWMGFHRKVEDFGDKWVARFWLGVILITALIDRRSA